jgi:hypothetical protein
LNKVDDKLIKSLPNTTGKLDILKSGE